MIILRWLLGHDSADYIPHWNAHCLGNGARGPITTRLQSRYFDVVHGRDEAHLGWLSPVA